MIHFLPKLSLCMVLTLWVSSISTLAPAADGLGRATVIPFQAVAGSTGNEFDFTYTAVSNMGDGAVKMTTASGWPNPTANNIMVTVVNGLTGEIINTLDSASGWTADIVGLGCLPLLCGDADVASDTNPRFAGTGSLEVSTSSISLLSSVRAYYTFPGTADWSGYTHLSFYIRNDSGFLNATLLSALVLQVSESEGLSNPTSYPFSSSLLDADVLNLISLTPNQWFQVIVRLELADGTTRDAVKSYGIVIPNVLTVALNGTFHLDHIMAGPADPVFSGNTVTQNLIYLDSGGTVNFNYSGITAPNTVGPYTFPVAQSSNSSGSLTTIAPPLPEIEVVAFIPPPVCGNDVCDGAETCVTCEDDCGPCNPPTCGNNACDGEETCGNCEQDCGECNQPTCGNNSCDGEETCGNCPQDCGTCNQPTCGNDVCDGQETCGSCEADCGPCNPPTCGNLACDGEETCGSCPQDCGTCNPPTCNNAVCDGQETCGNCPQDCGSCNPPNCGNNACDGDETCGNCEQDCGACNPPTCENQVCDGNETCGNCPQDCKACDPPNCGNNTCNADETCGNCVEDCLSCNPPNCGDNTCGSDETCGNCPQDCDVCDDNVGGQGGPGGPNPVAQGSGGSCSLSALQYRNPFTWMIPLLWPGLILALAHLKTRRPRK